MMEMPLFQNRADAGRLLGERVKPVVRDAHPVVLALPRGGVPVGFEVARCLHAELDAFVVRKLGMPGEEELAIGAIASGGVRILNEELIRYLGVSGEQIEQATVREQRELQRRERIYREGRPVTSVRDQTVVLVDDGLATGASMLAASQSVKAQGARRIIVAVPVAAQQTCDEFRSKVDEVICLATPNPFGAVGIWYEDFSQTTNEEVCKLLEEALHQKLSY
jgi:putative phosphoribosyl transferase